MPDRGDGQREAQVPDAERAAGGADGEVAGGAGVQARVHALAQVALQLPRVTWYNSPF